MLDLIHVCNNAENFHITKSSVPRTSRMEHTDDRFDWNLGDSLWELSSLFYQADQYAIRRYIVRSNRLPVPQDELPKLCQALPLSLFAQDDRRPFSNCDIFASSFYTSIFYIFFFHVFIGYVYSEKYMVFDIGHRV